MSNEPRAGTGLDPELLAAYIDQRLTPEQRRRVEAQLANDPDSYAVLVETMKAQEALGLEAKTAVPVRRSWVIAASALAAAAVIALAVWMSPAIMNRLRGDGVDPRFERLVAAVGDQRYLEPRLTGGFKYAPLRDVTRGPGDLSRQNLALLAAAGDLQKRAEESPSADNVELLGVAMMQLGDVDGAITQLERAVQLNSGSTRLCNLAAAYLVRAERSSRDADLALALDTVNRAVDAEPQLREAAFNRALILERFKLKDTAIKAWDAYLQLDDRSPWAEEARRHRAALLSQSRSLSHDEALRIVEREPSRACELVTRDALLMREAVDDVLLPAWADATMANDAAAGSSLEAATAIARCFAATGAGELTSRSVAAVVNADADGRRDLANAYQAWRQGRRAYARSAPDEFAPAFESARRVFERHHSPLALWTKQYAVAAMFYRGQLPEAVAAVTSLETDPQVVRGGALWARLQWIRASIHFQQAAFGQSLEEYKRALSAFETLHEGEHVVAMHQSLAEAYGRLGLERESWQEHRLALENIESARDYRRIHSALTAPGYTAAIAGLPAASLDFFSEGHARAVASGNLNYRFECEVGIGRALMALRKYPEAEEIYQSALALSPQVSNPSLRARHTADVYTGLSEIAASNHDYARSLKLVDEALAGVDAVSSEYLVASFHLRRGRTLRLTGDVEGAKAAFAAGINVLESKRALLQQTAQRVAYTDRAWDLYGDMISLVALDLNQPDNALQWVDRSRARSIQDHRQLPPLSQLRAARVPAGRSILVLAQTDRGLLTWLLFGDSFAFAPAPNSTISERFRDLGAQPSAQLLTDAYREIVRPFESHLAGIEHITIVPDWSTQSIPFAALSNGSRPWIADVAIDIAPTISSALAASAANAEPRPPTSIAIVTADVAPVDDAPLPGAAAEAKAIAALYPTVINLHGRDATVQSLRTAMTSVDVLHIAMHARADGRYLDRVTLEIPDAVTGLPLNAESALETIHAPPIVVLAACQTANGPKVRGEILMSLARPFMLAGSRYIIATLRDVPDRATNQLMTEFHRGLAAGKSPSVALAEAQRKFAHENGDPWWSAFVLVTTA